MNLSKLTQMLVNPAHINALENLKLPVELIEVRIDDFPEEPRDILFSDDICMVIKSDFPISWKMRDSDALLHDKQGTSDIELDDIKRFLASVNLSLDDVVALRIKAMLREDKKIWVSTEQSALRPPNDNVVCERGYDAGFVYAPREFFESDFLDLELNTKGAQDEWLLTKLAHQVDYLDQYLNNGIYEINIYDGVTNDVVRRGSVINDTHFDAIVDELIFEFVTEANYRNAN